MLPSVRFLALVAVLGCGCGEPQVGFGVAAQLAFDGAIDDASLARVASFSIRASGDEAFSQSVPLGRAPMRTERVVYRPLATSRRLMLAVDALDADAIVIASGVSGDLELGPGSTTSATVILFAPEPRDMAVNPGVDAGPDLPPPSTCPQLQLDGGVIGCAGYEAKKDTFDLYNSLGMSTIDPTRAYRGLSSLLMHIDSGNPGAAKFVESRRQGLPPAGAYMARGYFYFPAFPPQRGRFLTFQQASPINRAISAGLTTEGYLYTNVGVLSVTNGYHESALIAPLGRWLCLELRVTFGDATSGQVHLYLDDVEVPGTAYTGLTTDSPLPNNAFFGPYLSANFDTAYDFWLDEAIVGSVPIGCAK